jgi:hypothetical protein
MKAHGRRGAQQKEGRHKTVQCFRDPKAGPERTTTMQRGQGGRGTFQMVMAVQMMA